MTVDEKYAGTTAVSRLVWHIKNMEADSRTSLSRDLAILRFNVDLSNVNADQDMEHVVVWDFPDDVEVEEGSWDQPGNKFYSEVAS